MESTTNQAAVKKPPLLRVIFILNGLLMFLPFVFYYLITNDKLDVAVDPNWMLYTAGGYIVAFIVMVYCILNKKFQAFRGVFVASILMSIPAGAYIGILFGIISIGLSFTDQVKHYFESA